MTEIVATGTAKYDGGRCDQCNTLILRGNTIFKVSRKHTMTAPGKVKWHNNWVCGPCAYRIEGPK
jgi:hypothetical protein